MATVLKSGDRNKQKTAAQNASAIAGFNLSDLADEGRMRLEQCRLQVQEMLAKAEQEVEGIRKAAHELGYQQGLKHAEGAVAVCEHLDDNYKLDLSPQKANT